MSSTRVDVALRSLEERGFHQGAHADRVEWPRTNVKG
jgi:hypothetical protein